MIEHYGKLDEKVLGGLYLELASCNKIFDVLHTEKVPNFNQMNNLYEPDGSCPQRIFNLICKEGAVWFKAISKALMQYLNITNPIMLRSIIAAMLNFITDNGTLSDTSYSVIYTFMQMKYI